MTDETVKEPINAHKVAETERMKVMPALFGMRFAQVEQTVYQLMDRLCSTYQGGQWELYTLSNSSFYMAPRRADKLLIEWDGNGFAGEMSADAAGIVACLFTYYSATIILSGRRQLRWPVELVDSGVFLQGETDAWIPHQHSTIQALYETPRSRAHASERRR